jgi:hypothetical protein
MAAGMEFNYKSKSRENNFTRKVIDANGLNSGAISMRVEGGFGSMV